MRVSLVLTLALILHICYKLLMSKMRLSERIVFDQDIIDIQTLKYFVVIRAWYIFAKFTIQNLPPLLSFLIRQLWSKRSYNEIEYRQHLSREVGVVKHVGRKCLLDRITHWTFKKSRNMYTLCRCVHVLLVQINSDDILLAITDRNPRENNSKTNHKNMFLDYTIQGHSVSCAAPQY